MAVTARQFGLASTFEYTYMMERQLVYSSLQCGGTTIGSAEQ